MSEKNAYMQKYQSINIFNYRIEREAKVRLCIAITR